MLQSIVSQRVGHNLATEQQPLFHYSKKLLNDNNELDTLICDLHALSHLTLIKTLCSTKAFYAPLYR